MSVILALTIFISIVLCVLGGLVLLSPASQASRRSFAVMCVGLAVWVLSNFISDIDINNALFWARLTFFAVVVAIAAFTLFVNSFAMSRPSFLRKALFWGATAITSLVVWTDLFIPSVFFEEGIDSANVTTGPLYLVFIVYFVGLLVIDIIRLVRLSRKSVALTKQRINLILFAIAIMAVIGTITNLVLPLIMGVNPFSRIGTYSTVIFAAIIAYAMAKHRLFNIRLVIARALVYALTLAALTAFFISIIFFGLDRLLPSALSFEAKVLYTLAAVITAFIYQPIKHFFDKTTRRIFFRDLYESRDVLKEISDIAVHSSFPEELLRKAVTKIDSVIHPVFAQAFVRRSSGIELVYKIGSQHGLEGSLINKTPKKTLVVTDEMGKSGGGLSEEFLKHNIAVIVNLSTPDQQVGYIVLGYRINGSGYNDQDIALFDTIADELAVAIQNTLRFEEISQFNIKLKQEVEEATAQLRETNKKLRKLDEIKDEFISMASHQLRTPLTSIKGYISMVLEGDVGKVSPQQRELLDQAFSSTQRMVYLIGDFLNVSRLQTGKFIIEWKLSNLAEIVDQEIRQLKETAKRRDISLIYQRPQNFPDLYLDETKIHQVIMNFVDNAIFYTHPEGKVEVILSVGPNGVKLEVKDNGIGVPEDERHKLFTKFFRADNAKKARPDGTGIGLFMAKKVVAALGGSLIFESKEGKGSTFGFILPMSLKNEPKKLIDNISEYK